MSKVSLEFDFPGGSRPGSRREFRWSVAWLLGTGEQGKSGVCFPRGIPTSFAVGVQVVRGLARPGGPRRGGADPRASLRSPWADRRERANGIRGPARRGGPRRGGGSPEPRPRPTEANEPTDSPGWLARQGEVRSQTTKVPRAPQAEGRLALGFREPARSGTTPFGGQPSRGPKLSAQLSA